MPLIGYTCPPGVPTAGNRNGIHHCLGACPHPCVSPPLLAAIYAAEQKNHHKGPYLSASMLAGGGCKRQTVFERFDNFFEVPRRRYWPFRGTLAHRIVEDAGAVVEPYGWLQELRMSVPLHFHDLPAPIFDENGDFTGRFNESDHLVIDMGGTTDAYKLGLNAERFIDPATTRLDDYKTMADAKADMVIRGTKGGSFNKNVEDYWVWQTNIYSWLIAQTEITPAWKRRLKKLDIHVPRGMKTFPRPQAIHIQGIGMMEIPLTGGKYQPQRAKEAYDIDGIPVLPMEAVEAFIREKAMDWYKYLVLREELPPPVPRDEGWKCRNCPFNGDIIDGERCRPAETWASEPEPVKIDKPKRAPRQKKGETTTTTTEPTTDAVLDTIITEPTGAFPWEK